MEKRKERSRAKTICSLRRRMTSQTDSIIVPPRNAGRSEHKVAAACGAQPGRSARKRLGCNASGGAPRMAHPGKHGDPSGSLGPLQRTSSLPGMACRSTLVLTASYDAAQPGGTHGFPPGSLGSHLQTSSLLGLVVASSYWDAGLSVALTTSMTWRSREDARRPAWITWLPPSDKFPPGKSCRYGGAPRMAHPGKHGDPPGSLGP